MSDLEFLMKMEELYKRMKRLHGATVTVIISCAAVISAFGIMIINQGFQTARETAKVVQTQGIMYEVMDGRINDLDTRIDKANDYTREQRAEMQRQLDLLLKDQKLVQRGASIQQRNGPQTSPK